MNKTELTAWLDSQNATIERIILEAAQSFVLENQGQQNFGYDLQCAQKEAYNLMNSDDLCYDRYTTPLAYSLWYQARRMNVFFSHFLNKIIEACTAGRPIEIFDLGAGTGCVQFCFGLAYVASKRLKKQSPLLRIINVDSSPIMLNYLRCYLWPVAVKYYPELKELPIEYHVYCWSNRGAFSITNPWVCASYLFDSSENEDYLLANFEELIKAFDPSKVLLLTSAQEKKKKLMNSLTIKLRKNSYQLLTNTNAASVFTGQLNSVTAFRQSLIKEYNLKASSSSVTWSDGSFVAIGLEKTQTGFAYDIRTRPESLDIFNPPLRIRRDVQLNDDQKRAARFETRPSIITGPAGCGKSIVITEKIINILEENAWNGSIRILITTFNKSLLKQLREWLTDLIISRNKKIVQQYNRVLNGVNDGTGELRTGVDNKIVIKFVHFEMLGQYVGGIQYTPFDERIHISALEAIVRSTKKQLSISESEMTDILNSSFLLEEYHRVVYGLQCRINLGEEHYQNVARIGRGRKPRLEKGERRKAVWTALSKYTSWMHTDPNAGQSYMARRQLLYNKLFDKQVNDLFDYVFVDEFQDCTATDFKIMGLLLKNVNNLILAGDLAQAVHIGQSGTIPRDEAMGQRIYHRLNGSYRLPFRICESIYPLSQHIARNSNDKDVTAEITPYKGAPPGARPVVVYAENDRQLAEKIIAIKKSYSVFELNRVTIMEKDERLCKELRSLREIVETTTILRLKGLEKEFIVWSLQANVEYENEVFEFAYTIMTRTNCLLVVAITNDHKKIYPPILQYLRQDRLIFWDAETEAIFKSLLAFENVVAA